MSQIHPQQHNQEILSHVSRKCVPENLVHHYLQWLKIDVTSLKKIT
jgi:hypothetical protein